jgi:hypothetical protein
MRFVGQTKPDIPPGRAGASNRLHCPQLGYRPANLIPWPLPDMLTGALFYVATFRLSRRAL